jgi:hypothetical protein
MTKRLIPFFFMLSLCLPGAVRGSAVVTIEGKLTSITESHYLVETKNAVYYISRKAVSADQAEKIKATDTQVALSVDPEAITVVKSKRKRPKG